MAKVPRILLVDDELSVIKMVGKRLEVEGFDVVVAMDGQAALDMARSASPDLIILDLMLPKLNGYEVCKTLKQDPAFKRIPIVIFTAKTHEADERRAMDQGADAYVRKPFRSEELLRSVWELLPQSGPPRPA